MNGIAIMLTNHLRATREADAAVLTSPAKAVAPTPSEKAALIPGRKTKARKVATYDVRPAVSFAAPAITSDPAGDAWAKAIKEVNAGLPGSTLELAEPQADRSAALFAQVEQWREEGR